MTHKIFLFLRKLWDEYGTSIIIGAALGFISNRLFYNPQLFLAVILAMFPIINLIILSLMLGILLLPYLGVVLEILSQFIQTGGLI